MVEQTFGPYLTKERKRAGYTLRRLAHEAGSSSSTLSRWENDHFVPARDDAVKLDKALKLRGALFRKWEKLTSESTLLPWMQNAGNLEEAASLIEYVSPVLVPGLLQSPSYAEIVFREGQPLSQAAEIRRLVSVRCGRYEHLRTRNDPRVSAVFPVSALLCVPQSVRIEQVDHLLSMDRVSLHLVPEGSALIGITSPMLLVRLLEGGKAASADHLTGNVVYGETDGFDRLTELVKRALAMALPTPQSRKVLEELR
ncbi:helix-turn-helix transcriptional regulator [Nocardiopsis sp. MG754419]|uniref:helix-turn-helix domain-containing protein n=1 Tax=Nocardiopsis sp. MG754419 TaxID=2259865 RepID=UPI001BAB1BB7|nr:helix-turn-helix transcriptional regulator [Nocardiopsis sp. MG754419]MBR8744043.1 XRE family transcriptional regulator [Nocardiopsis sp. MG754419]